jgi:hypothetical protein
VVGQQIMLTATANLPEGATLTTSKWTVAGTNIGGYTASTTGIVLTDTITNATNITFYWVSPGSSLSVTYQYCATEGDVCPSATTTFNVTGPTEANITASAEAVGIAPDQSEVAWGIKFAASSIPPGQASGTYQWVQLVQSDQVTLLFQDGTNLICTQGPGLDTSYPYSHSTGSNAEDGPSVGLDAASSNEIEVTDSTTFQMYLMWNPGIGSSIPVTLGYLPWNISGDAVYNSATKKWSLKPGTSATNSSPFVASNVYPTWDTTISGSFSAGAGCN